MIKKAILSLALVVSLVIPNTLSAVPVSANGQEDFGGSEPPSHSSEKPRLEHYDMRIVDGSIVDAPYDFSYDVSNREITVTFNGETSTMKYLGGTGKTKPPVIFSSKGHSTITWVDIELDTDLQILLMPKGVFYKRIIKSKYAPHTAQIEISDPYGKVYTNAKSMSGVPVTVNKSMDKGVLTESFNRAELVSEYSGKVVERQQEEGSFVLMGLGEKDPEEGLYPIESGQFMSFGEYFSGVASIDPDQDYDIIYTLELKEGTEEVKVILRRGSSNPVRDTVYYREGTSGDWSQQAVGFTGTIITGLSATTIQVGHSWNKSGNNYTTAAFSSQETSLSIEIAQRASLSGIVGDSFMYQFAYFCSSLRSLDTPSISGITEVGHAFLREYARNCSSLTYLTWDSSPSLGLIGNTAWYQCCNSCSSLLAVDMPDTTNAYSVGSNFMQSYAQACILLTELSVPSTKMLTSAGDAFFSSYAFYCQGLLSLEIPSTSSLENIGGNFMSNYAYNTPLTSLILPTSTGQFALNPINWGISSSRLGILKAYVGSLQSKLDWQALTEEGETLYINYIRSHDDVIYDFSLEYLDIETLECTEIADVSVRANGRVIDLAGAVTLSRGFCYLEGEDLEPTVTDVVVLEEGEFEEEDYSLVITSLKVESTYSIRAFVDTEFGIAYGNTVEVTTLPTKPWVAQDFTATQEGNNVKLSWHIGQYADGVIIVKGFSGFPKSPTDGVEIYSGDDTEFIDEGASSDTSEIYYSAFSYSPWGTNIDEYATTSVGGEMLLFFIMVILGIALLITSIVFKKWPLLVLSGLVWIIVGIPMWSNPAGSVEWSFAWVFIALAIFCILYPFILSRQASQEAKKLSKGAYKTLDERIIDEYKAEWKDQLDRLRDEE